MLIHLVPCVSLISQFFSYLALHDRFLHQTNVLNFYKYLVNYVICLINHIIFFMYSFIFLLLHFIGLFTYLYIIIQNLFINLLKLSIAISKNKIKKLILCTTFLLAPFYKLSCLIFYMPKRPSFSAPDKEIMQEIMHTFVGGGPSAQFDFKMLKPYIISTNFQVQNPENFYYLYDGHGSSNKVTQKNSRIQ